MQSSRTLFENGEMAVTLPTAALSGCGFGPLKCETEKSTSEYLIGKIMTADTCPEGGTFPLLKHTCFLRRGRRGRTSGWEKKNRASKEEETSDNVQEEATYLYVT